MIQRISTSQQLSDEEIMRFQFIINHSISDSHSANQTQLFHTHKKKKRTLFSAVLECWSGEHTTQATIMVQGTYMARSKAQIGIQFLELPEINLSSRHQLMAKAHWHEGKVGPTLPYHRNARYC